MNFINDDNEKGLKMELLKALMRAMDDNAGEDVKSIMLANADVKKEEAPDVKVEEAPVNVEDADMEMLEGMRGFGNLHKSKKEKKVKKGWFS